MTARSEVQWGSARQPESATTTEDAPQQQARPAKAAPAAGPVADPRYSPDPFQATDRYRLVTPYRVRL